MKNLLPSFGAAITFFLVFEGASLHAQNSEWLATKAKTDSPGMILPDQDAIYDLTLSDATGVELGEKPPTGADKKSLTFSGEQTTCFRSAKPFPISSGKTRVELLANISDLGSDEESTLIRVGSQWELRYSQNERSLLLICWHNDQNYTTLRAPVETDRWQKIEAEFDSAEMALTVAGKKVIIVPQDAMRDVTASEPLFLGASNPNDQSGEGLPRPFVGSMAEIRVSVE